MRHLLVWKQGTLNLDIWLQYRQWLSSQNLMLDTAAPDIAWEEGPPSTVTKNACLSGFETRELLLSGYLPLLVQ